MPHVPKTDTHFIENISFETVLEAAMLPSAEYDVSKWPFVPNIYTEYRYILGTRGSRPLICIGVNPSTAAPDRLDPTMQSVQRIALQNGYDSFVMCNVYAQRATSPKDMDRKCNGKLHQENLRAFMCALSLYDTQKKIYIYPIVDTDGTPLDLVNILTYTNEGALDRVDTFIGRHDRDEFVRIAHEIPDICARIDAWKTKKASEEAQASHVCAFAIYA